MDLKKALEVRIKVILISNESIFVKALSTLEDNYPKI